MAKKRVIVQQSPAQAPKGRRQKVKYVVTVAPVAQPNMAAEDYMPVGPLTWPAAVVDGMVSVVDTFLVAALVVATIAFLAYWTVKHPG